MTTQFRSLRSRLLRPLLALSFISATVAALGIFVFENIQLKQELQLRGQLLSSALVIAAETSSSLGDFHRTVMAMAGEPNIDSINVVDFDYRPIFAGDNFDIHRHPDERKELDGLAQQAVARNMSIGAVDQHDSSIYQVVTRLQISALNHDNVLKPKPTLLIVNLLASESQHKAINRTIILALLFSSIGFTALIMIYYLMSRWVLIPAMTIVEVMRKQSVRETANTGFEATDELGLIGKTFDNLAKTLSEREHALEQAVSNAQEASIAKSQFLANMSHELRTPMNAILGMTSLLLKTPLTHRQADYAIKTESAAQSELGLLNDILDVSKAEAGKMELDPVPFTLDHLIRDLSVILSTNLTDKAVELVFDLAADVPRYLFGDAMRLKQILINLGSNAIKFTERGQVTIRIILLGTHNRSDEKNSSAKISTNEHGFLEFSVHDTGIGIAPENQTKIFNGFTQAEASTTRRFGGTGLGLAISQKLVQLMGGDLKLSSALGQGSRFYFAIELPLLSPEGIAALNASIASSNLQKGKARLHGMHILLTEDNINNQQIAVELLEGEGAIVRIANNGEEAVDILRGNSDRYQAVDFDIVLMDVQMPVMDGFTATKIIRNELKLTTLPIVAMTANAMVSDREECLNAGMNEHVGKPFDLKHLITVITEQTNWAAKTTLAKKIEETEISPHFLSPIAANIAKENGFDIDAAIARLGGRPDRYHRMLPSFIASLSALPNQFRKSLEEDDRVNIAREMHSLKGMAAQMGILVIATEAANSEKFMHDEPSRTEIEAMVERVIESIQRVLLPLQDLHEAIKIEKPKLT